MPGLSSDTNDRKLLQAVCDRNFDEVKAAFEAGGNVNGPREQRLPPIAAAVIAKHASMIAFLLEQGADPDKPVTHDAGIVEFLLEQGADPDKPVTCGLPGERALHITARNENVEIARLLPNWYSADVNATDNRGYTPLTATCENSHVYVEMVRSLLEAGADPAIADKDGRVPLHVVASRGHMDLVDMLYSTAPATLNLCASNAETPLCIACSHGHESMVSKLLSLGATQRMPLDAKPSCPLSVAAGKGFVGVVRVLINEGGITAVGGDVVLALALGVSVATHRPRVLRLLLTWDGEKRRSKRANSMIKGWCLLHYGAAYCYPAAVSILLEAGADDAARDADGRIALDDIGADIGEDNPQIDRGQEVAIRRMLQRGPAYRARSWAWPSDEEADAGGSGDCDTAGVPPAGSGAGGTGAADAAALSSRAAANPPPPL